MPWEVNSRTYNPDDIDKGFRVPEPGRYHVQVTAVDENAQSSTGTPQMIVDMEILGGTTPQQEGINHREYFAKTDSEGSVNRFLIFALATKITNHDELERHKKAGTNPVIDPAHAVGRQLCVELENEEYPAGSGKVRPKAGFRMFAVDNPKAKGIPLNTGMLRKQGDGDADPFAGGTQPATGNLFGGSAAEEESPF